nr:hypothetical protein [Tanacetum cinerariifolium]
MNHQTSSIPQVIQQVAYQSPQAPTQLMTESLFVDSCFDVPVFSPGDDPIACLNKAMAILTAVASSRFHSTNNQLRTSSNTRNQATIQDDRVIVQQVQRRQGKYYSGTMYKGNTTSSRGNTTSGQARVVKCYNCQGEGHIARQCTQPKRPRNATWFKEKAMLAEAYEAGQILDEEQLAFLADPGIPADQAQTIIPHNAAFQTEDLDTYDSDCDDLSTAQAVLMANISNYGSDVILEKAQRIKPTLYDGIIISEKHVAMPVIDDEETLILEEESRSNMSEKEKDPEAIKQNIYHKPIDYEKLNRLTDDFGKRFTPQQELSAEQAFWLRTSNPTIESSSIPPVRVEVPSELPNVSLVNEILKKLKFQLSQFDFVVKKRTTPNALTKEVRTIFDQIEAAVQQYLVDKQCLEIANKELHLENDRLSIQIMSQDIVSTIMNCMSLDVDCMNVGIQMCESREKCLDLDAVFSNQNKRMMLC